MSQCDQGLTIWVSWFSQIHRKNDPSEFKNPGSRAENLFQRMDLNSDGEVTKEEFLKFCRKDEAMAKLFDQKGEGGHALFFGLWL